MQLSAPSPMAASHNNHTFSIPCTGTNWATCPVSHLTSLLSDSIFSHTGYTSSEVWVHIFYSVHTTHLPTLRVYPLLQRFVFWTVKIYWKLNNKLWLHKQYLTFCFSDIKISNTYFFGLHCVTLLSLCSMCIIELVITRKHHSDRLVGFALVAVALSC